MPGQLQLKASTEGMPVLATITLTLMGSNNHRDTWLIIAEDLIGSVRMEACSLLRVGLMNRIQKGWTTNYSTGLLATSSKVCLTSFPDMYFQGFPIQRQQTRGFLHFIFLVKDLTLLDLIKPVPRIYRNSLPLIFRFLPFLYPFLLPGGSFSLPKSESKLTYRRDLENVVTLQ